MDCDLSRVYPASRLMTAGGGAGIDPAPLVTLYNEAIIENKLIIWQINLNLDPGRNMMTYVANHRKAQMCISSFRVFKSYFDTNKV